MTKIRYRDISIDILKFIAVLFVINSHMDVQYGDYSILATGGAFGDALFFFCSGYTLLLGSSFKQDNYFNWYKRRINRIYPTVFSWALVASLIGLLDNNFFSVVYTGAGKWFVSCIMLYYAIFGLIQRWVVNNRIYIIYLLNVAFILFFYFMFGFDKQHSVYMGHFKWCHYFLYMIMGAQLGLHKANIIKNAGDSITPPLFKTLICLFVSILSFYALCWFKYKDGVWDFVQMLSLIPLAFCCYYFWQLCNTDCASKIFANKYCGIFIRFIGGMCLEIYMVQRGLLDAISDSWNAIFPLNLILLFILIVLSAYVLKCISRFWVQTFKDEDYNWRNIIKPY